MAAQPHPEKIARLRDAIEQYEAGQAPALFDREAEEARAPVRKRALGLLDQRARSRAELRGRLIDAEFPPEVVDDVLEDLERSQLIDDQSFANEWVRQRAKRRGKSARVLDMELKDKGVDPSIRAEALEQISDEDEESTARAVAEKKARSEKIIPADRADYDKALRRVVGALARRGFSSGMSMTIAREALDARLDELRSS